MAIKFYDLYKKPTFLSRFFYIKSASLGFIDTANNKLVSLFSVVFYANDADKTILGSGLPW